MMIRVGVLGLLLESLLVWATFTQGGVTSPVTADDGSGKSLSGSWGGEGVVIVFSADGMGKNPDGSRFRWELKQGRLFARSLSKADELGEEWSVPIAFTQDGKEFSYLLGSHDGGLMRVTRYKLDPEGHRFEGRTEADRAYPKDSEALKGEGRRDPLAPAPVRPKSVTPPGPN